MLHAARRFEGRALLLAGLLALLGPETYGAVTVDLEGYRPESGIKIKALDERLEVSWPIAENASGRLVLDTRAGRPLIERLGIESPQPEPPAPILTGVDPVTFLTVGSRESPQPRPASMSVFNVFFDSPAKRPHQSHRAVLDLKRLRVVSEGHRASVIFGNLSAGPFRGELHVTVYLGAPLIHVEAVVSTEQERQAYTYDAGLAAASPSWTALSWMDTEGRFEEHPFDPNDRDQPLAVRHRTLIASSPGGSIACFPPPHQFFYPRDYTDNQRTVWHGQDHRGLEPRAGFGVRQTESGGGNYSPWFNAPPGTQQRLGVFYLISRKAPRDVLTKALKYTHDDSFPALPGRVTFTSHWHMAIAMAALKEQAQGSARTIPDFARMFKEMNVNLVHLAEFHGDGHQHDPGPIRLPEMKAMFDECRRLSDDSLLMIPGEEINAIVGEGRKGGPPGHWITLFPKPVSWTQRKAKDAPFVEDDPTYGTVYHVGGEADMTALLKREHGLAWTAHPRIKASNFAPDVYRHDDFYKADSWLGSTFKAMPADLSRPRLGERGLDLLDDMNNWGERKQIVGEVDVFKIDHTHELYGHMNVNYLKLDRVPKFDDGWQPVLDALRAGRFFVSTGEVLIHDFKVEGRESGATLPAPTDAHAKVHFELAWTFPMKFAELVSGDGTTTHRQRLDLTETEAFGRRRFALDADLRGRTWVRLEAWDVAANGAFTQPIWIGPETPAR